MKDGYTPGTHLMKAVLLAFLAGSALWVGIVDGDGEGAAGLGLLTFGLAVSQVDTRSDYDHLKDTFGL